MDGAVVEASVELQPWQGYRSTRFDLHFHLSTQYLDLRDQGVEHDPVARIYADAGLHGLPVEVEPQKVCSREGRRSFEPVAVRQRQPGRHF